jgi:signal transduction histidine kinase
MNGSWVLTILTPWPARSRRPEGGGTPAGVVALGVCSALADLAGGKAARKVLFNSAQLATVSHELKTPLTVILGTLGTLGRRGTVLEPAERREFVDMAVRQGTRLKELIERLLLAARFEQAPAEPWPRPGSPTPGGSWSCTPASPCPSGPTPRQSSRCLATCSTTPSSTPASSSACP